MLIQKDVLKLVCNKTKSSYLLLTKDIPKANPYKNVYQANASKRKKWVIILIGDYIEIKIGHITWDHEAKTTILYCKNQRMVGHQLAKLVAKIYIKLTFLKVQGEIHRSIPIAEYLKGKQWFRKKY